MVFSGSFVRAPIADAVGHASDAPREHGRPNGRFRSRQHARIMRGMAFALLATGAVLRKALACSYDIVMAAARAWRRSGTYENIQQSGRSAEAFTARAAAREIGGAARGGPGSTQAGGRGDQAHRSHPVTRLPMARRGDGPSGSDTAERQPRLSSRQHRDHRAAALRPRLRVVPAS